MTISKSAAALADISEADVVAEDGHHMLQQNMWDAHGHEMHPQQFVRLVGCHDPKFGHPDLAVHLKVAHPGPPVNPTS